MNEIILGCIARDKISGFEGTVIATTNWLNGCKRITIQPNALKDGKRIECDTFDVQQVEYVKAGSLSAPVEAAPSAPPAPIPTRPGGPTIHPTRAADPK